MARIASYPDRSRFALRFPFRQAGETKSPSTTIYVERPLDDLLSPVPVGVGENQADSTDHETSGRALPPFDPHRPLRALSPNAFHWRAANVANEGAIVVRDCNIAVRRRVLSMRGRSAYVIDDDVESGARDRSLPPAYRRRLARLADGGYRDLVRRADIVLTPSEVLSSRIAARTGRSVETIQPSLLAPVAALDHHDEEDLRIVYPNTRSHFADWIAVRSQVFRFVARNEKASLVTFLGRRGDRAGLRHIVDRASAPWPEFCRTFERDRFHIAVLPGLDTAFNAARSHNKLLECAMWGAVPVVSRHLPYSGIVEREGLGLVCGGGRSDSWKQALEALRDPARRKAMAARNVAWAERIGDPRLMRDRWLNILT